MPTQFVRYCSVDKQEVPPFDTISNLRCKCHNEIVLFYCMDCEDYIKISCWQTHIISNPKHRRRDFSDLEAVSQVQLDLNADSDEGITVQRKRKKKVLTGYTLFFKKTGKQGLTREEIWQKWDALTADEKYEYNREAYYALESDDEKKKRKRKSYTTGYTQFVISASAPGKTINEVADSWRSLSQDEKDVFIEKAKQITMERDTKPRKKRRYRRHRNGFHEYCTSLRDQNFSRKEMIQKWKSLSKDEKEPFSKLAIEYNSTFVGDEESEESEEEQSEEESEEETLEMIEPRKKPRYYGYQEFQVQKKGSGLTAKQLGILWRELSETDRKKYNEAARKRLEYSSEKELEEVLPVSTMEETAVILSLLIRAEKEEYITKIQFEKLQAITMSPDHHLRSTVVCIAKLTNEYREKKHSYERWKTMGLPLVQNVLQLNN